MSRKKRSLHPPTDTNTVLQFRRPARKNSVELIPKTVNQETYITHLLDESRRIVFGVGPAGTGKTLLATMAAIKAYKEGRVEKIVITRPAVGTDDEKHGFLPGTINQKMEPWTRPLFDVLHEYYSPKDTARMLEEQIIEISPLAYMRGRTFKGSYIIADEMQNTTVNQMKMLLTRLGHGSFMAVTGDIDQKDIIHNNGLEHITGCLHEAVSEVLRLVTFTSGDCQREEVVKEVLGIYA